jgi:hypothetical protein
MRWLKAYVIVVLGAMVGMVLGGLFGLGAGLLAPGLFAHLVPWSDVEPLGAAIVCGGVAGVLLGGGLAAFALVIQAVGNWKRRDQ